VVKSIDEVFPVAEKMLGMTLVTKQTGPAGKEVKRVYIEEGCDIKRECYMSMLIDRATSKITIIASTEGGMDIEEVAAKTPEKILKVAVDPATGIQPFHGRKVAFGLKMEGKQVSACVKFVLGMYKAFTELDASLVEINPLVVTGAGDVIALDAKMNFDDNALFRHKDIQELRDEDEEDAAEREAARHDLNFIKLYGGDPANFLDVGGGATKDRVTEAFKIILRDPNVEGILVNIFGGIMRCDVIADGIVSAAREVSLNVPLVVRLEGTNVDLGKQILSESNLPIISADDLADAAEKIVKAVKEAA
jgi:succinyl-CoA synthetase beta subunit